MNRSQRRFLRRPQAALQARQRKAEDPFEQARSRALEADLPPSCRTVMAVFAERHHELGKGCRNLPVLMGYGGRPAAERPRQEGPRLPDLAKATGLHRRTVQRAMKLLLAAGVGLHKLFGGPDGVDEHGMPLRQQRVYVPCRRERYEVEGQVRYRPIGERLQHTIGRGGCDKGGVGLANAYWVDGIPDPEPEPTPPPAPALPAPEGEPPPPADRRPLAERFRELHPEPPPRRPRGP